jgi:type IV secretion system protein VirB6
MIAGIMLALGPVFAAFLLFEGTRGLFEGWIRVLAGTAFGALGTALIVGIELALLEPWLVQLITWRNAGYATPGAPTELLVVALVFALAILAVVTASWRLAVGFGLPAAWRAAPQQLREVILGDERKGRTPSDKDAVIERSRATRVAQAMTGTLRREAAAGGGAMPPRLARPHESGRDRARGPQVPLGQSYRRTRQRVSGSAARRDRAS